MQPHPHRERTVRLLETRLETLACATERSLSGRGLLDRHVLAVAAATRHAIELEIVTHAEADEIWAVVARRHPGVHWCRVGPGLAA